MRRQIIQRGLLRKDFWKDKGALATKEGGTLASFTPKDESMQNAEKPNKFFFHLPPGFLPVLGLTERR